MTTAETFTPSSTPILMLGGCVLVTAIILLILAGVGLRALALGRDEVCVFSLRFFLELIDNAALAGRSVRRIHELPAKMSTLRPADDIPPIADSGIFRVLPLLYLRLNFFLLRRRLRHVRARRAIRSNHYQTYGARMRARTSQNAA